MAASIESQIGETSGDVSFSCLKENTDQVLALFRDLLTAPEFRAGQSGSDQDADPQRNLAPQRRCRRDRGARVQQTSSTAATRPTAGRSNMPMSTTSIARIFMDFYHRYYFPANIIAGSVWRFFHRRDEGQAGTAVRRLEVHAAASACRFPKVEDKAAPGVFLASKDDTTQTFFRCRQLGGELRDKDYPALEVAARFWAVVSPAGCFAAIRTKHGWAYNISCILGRQLRSSGNVRDLGQHAIRRTRSTR